MVEVLEFPEQTHAGTGKLPTAFLQKKLGIIQKPAFKYLLPPLSEDEYKGLEANILKEGCHEPLILWDNVIIDGHNRYEICCKHNVIFKTKDVTFKNDLDAKIWIVEHQLKHRRNLSDKDKIKGVLLLEGFYKEKANENQGTRTDLSCERKTSSRETEKEKRARRNANCVNAHLADLAGVSTDKVFRYKEILEHGTPEEIEAVDSGEAKICPTYDKMAVEISQTLFVGS